MANPLSRRAVLAAVTLVVALALLLLLDDPFHCEDLSGSTLLRLRRLSSTAATAETNSDPCDDKNDRAPEPTRRWRDDVVHTFFEPIDQKTRGPQSGDPAPNSTDVRTLDAWRSAWESKGWTVRVLTLEDARRHPDFGAFDAALNSVPLGGSAYYNRLCYLRWLAMAAVGGGWMSDFDVVPVAGPSARGDSAGGFTSFGGSVPSLLYGSSDEWTRMAHLLLDAAKKGKSIPVGGGKYQLYSDMMGLQALRSPPSEKYVVRNEVLQSYADFRELITGPMTAKRRYTQEECHKLGRYRAVHFSHVAVADALGVDPWELGGKGAMSLEEKLRDRPMMIMAWTEMLAKCGDEKKSFVANHATA